MPNESFKILGIISVAIAVAAAWLLFKMWPKGRAASISQHGGGHKTAYWIFLSVLIGDGFLFFLFMREWFIPAMALPAGFGWLLALGYLLQIATAIIPDKADGSRTAQLHGVVAFSMAGVMPMLTLWITLAPGVAAAPRFLAGLATFWMALCVYLFIFVKSTHKHFLIYQTSYIASFYASILAATYIR